MKPFILTLLSFTVILAGCSSLSPAKYRVDSSIKPHIRTFNIHYKYFNKKKIPYTTRIYIANIVDRKHASGVYYINDDLTILSKKHWKKYSYYQREALFFHEMGHHILKRDHYWNLPRKFKDGCPKSIMFWKTFSTSCYLKRRSTYIKELFKNKDKFGFSEGVNGI